MTIYASELPKSCLQCPCCALSKSKPEYVEEWDCIYCNPLRQGMRWKPNERLKLKDCPLQSLADYTKQVRKEVCEQIKAEFDTSGFNKISASLYPPTEEAMWIGKGFNACKERLFNKLDQIQGDRV